MQGGHIEIMQKLNATFALKKASAGTSDDIICLVKILDIFTNMGRSSAGKVQSASKMLLRRKPVCGDICASALSGCRLCRQNIKSWVAFHWLVVSSTQDQGTWSPDSHKGQFISHSEVSRVCLCVCMLACAAAFSVLSR